VARLPPRSRGFRRDPSRIAAKSAKEVAYHVERSGDWVIRLGDGTDESHAKMQAAIDA
jgi:ring-1,2-phenylacetyl-CoA epoxidase subunit PaaC